jgi:hypothetical protein
MYELLILLVTAAPVIVIAALIVCFLSEIWADD